MKDIDKALFKKLEDFTVMSDKKFWEYVNDARDAAKDICDEYWPKAQEEELTQSEAFLLLNCLFIHSHARILDHSKSLAQFYPTKQLTKNRLAKLENLWWTDHFTAGISKWSTLNWFSANKTKTGKDGKKKFNGASTHFVCGYHDLPFYIIPLMHGAWHEPRRNKDSISIEMVNAGALHREGDNWHYWAKQLPLTLVQELPPVMLDKAYRGVKVMQPFTKEQLLNNLTLKRVSLAALGERLAPERMSQHSDWRGGKTDMGPIWPFDDINEAMFSLDPLPEMDFIQQYEDFLDEEGTIWDEVDGWDTHDESNNPEYGNLTPTHDDDVDAEDDGFFDTDDVQQALARKGYNVKVDGKMGPQTRQAITSFQRDWNKTHPSDLIKVDGIAGPATCQRLQK